MDTSGIADDEGMENAVFTYRWMAGGTDIPGGTGSTYMLVDDDEGRTIQVRVTFTDDVGNEETLTGAATEGSRPGDPRRIDGVHLRNRVQRGVPAELQEAEVARL